MSDPSGDAPRVVMAHYSPMLADPSWINGFRWMVGQLLDAGKAADRHGAITTYRATVIETRWKPFLNGLAAHVLKAVEDGRNGPPIRVYGFDGNVGEAYQIACAAFDEVADHAGPNEAMMKALEDIADKLSRWQPPSVTAQQGGTAPPEGPPSGTGDVTPIKNGPEEFDSAKYPESFPFPDAPSAIAAARRDEEEDDSLPDPSSLTLAGLHLLLTDVEHLRSESGLPGKCPPELERQIIRRENCMLNSAGFKGLETYLNVRLGEPVTIKAVDKVIRGLSNHLKKRFEDVRRITILEAVAILNKPTPGPHGALNYAAVAEQMKNNPPRAIRANVGPPRVIRKPPARAAALSVILGKPKDQPMIGSKTKDRLTLARYNVVKALLDAGDRGLTGDALVLKSGHGGAVNVLKTLARKDPDWGAVISLPGQPGGRYRIVSESDGD